MSLASDADTNGLEEGRINGVNPRNFVFASVAEADHRTFQNLMLKKLIIII